MPKGQKNIASFVENAIKVPLSDIGYDIWDVEYVKEGSEWYLRVTIDSDKGVDIDDCEKAMRLIDPIITDLDPVEGAYHLEVSSPGLERSIRTDAHYAAVTGQTVLLKLFTPIDGKREIIGVLTDSSGDVLVVKTPENEMRIEKKRVSRANVYFDFNSIDYGDETNE